MNHVSDRVSRRSHSAKKTSKPSKIKSNLGRFSGYYHVADKADEADEKMLLFYQNLPANWQAGVNIGFGSEDKSNRFKLGKHLWRYW